MARLCYEEAMKYALVRKTFGKTLVQHQLVRFKLAEMARQIECLQDFVERVAYQFASGVPDAKLGGQCAMLKVQASKTFEFCSREASQIFGGSSIVKEGKGKVVERLAREVRGFFFFFFYHIFFYFLKFLPFSASYPRRVRGDFVGFHHP